MIPTGSVIFRIPKIQMFHMIPCHFKILTNSNNSLDSYDSCDPYTFLGFLGFLKIRIILQIPKILIDSEDD